MILNNCYNKKLLNRGNYVLILFNPSTAAAVISKTERPDNFSMKGPRSYCYIWKKVPKVPFLMWYITCLLSVKDGKIHSIDDSELISIGFSLITFS